MPVEASNPGDNSSDGRIEMTNMRTANSRTYELPNGRLITQLFAQPIYSWNDSATDILVGDPYLHFTSQYSIAAGGWRKPLYSKYGQTGVVWKVPVIDLADALDKGYDKHGNPRQPIWY